MRKWGLGISYNYCVWLDATLSACLDATLSACPVSVEIQCMGEWPAMIPHLKPIAMD